MLFGRKRKRNEARKKGPPRRVGAAPSTPRRLRVLPAAVLIGLVFIIATSLIITVGGQVMPWRAGHKPPQAIRVRARFAVHDDQATQQARIEARESTPNYYKLNDAFLAQIERDLTGLYVDLTSTDAYEKLPEAKRKGLLERWKIDAKTFEDYKKHITTLSADQFKELIDRLKTSLAETNIIAKMPEAYAKVAAVMLTDPSGQTSRPAEHPTFIQNREKVDALVTDAAKVLSPPLRSIVADDLVGRIQPVWIFDKAKTDNRREVRYASPENIRTIEYEPGQVLVHQHHQITQRDFELLQLEHRAYWESLGKRTKVLAYAGTLAIVALITLVMGAYCLRFEPRAIHNWTRSLALALILLLMIVLARVWHLSGLNNYTSVFQVVLVASVMTVVYNQRFALMVTTALACLVMLTLGGDVSLFLALLGGGITVILTLDEVRSRSKLTAVAGASALMSFAVVWAVELSNYHDLTGIVLSAAVAGAAAFVAVFIFQGILPLIERLFQVATSMTLLEWCDASKPLLRRLALETPGTFNHSLLLGAMAEAAAEAIGANGLLARVGAYYHDIGKITKREYFVENQPDPEATRHKDLSPAMSLLIIIGHVKDGLEIAKEYGLPRVLHQFIAEHHGTTLVEYFYHRAAQQRSEAGEEAPGDVEFRYPGPKPRGKESGILMLADSVEGATRALSEPTAGRIEAQVHQIVERKLEDGQMDECELSLKELHQIEESLTKSLWGIYHGRIRYPSQEESPAAPAQMQPSK